MCVLFPLSVRRVLNVSEIQKFKSEQLRYAFLAGMPILQELGMPQMVY